MAFVLEERDLVLFHVNKNFSNQNNIISKYIARGDEDTLLTCIHLYMEKTNKNSSLARIAVRRPRTPIIRNVC
jgi:hypothetical protein